MSKKIFKTANAALLTVALMFGGAVFNAVNANPGGGMRDMTTQQIVEDMGLGINLGNTFESVCHWLPGGSCGPTVTDYETGWGSPVITRAIIQGYKAAGFKTVRVPVAWSNMMTGDLTGSAGSMTGGTFTIAPALMNRVQEVIDWILDEDMYVILNIHWDGGWWEYFSTDSTICMQKFRRIWEQVGEHFKDYGDRLIFASLNEEGGWDDIWYIWRNGSDLVAKQRSYTLLNVINQAFVDLIRAQGGNNASRHLQIQGYHTDIDRTIDPMFLMPTDTRTPARLAVSVHYYDPFAFTHISEPVDWGGIINPRTTWGTPADRAEINNAMQRLKTHFVDNGIPVIIGEYGVASWDAKFERELASVRDYTLALTEAMLTRGIAPVLWDTQLNPEAGEHVYYYNRRTSPPGFVDPLMVAGFRELAGLDPSSIRSAANNRPAPQHRPTATVRGRTLSVSSPVTTDLQIRVIDIMGRTRASFNAGGGAGSFSVSQMPAGRYFVEMKGAGVGRTVLPFVLK
jgi:endoglucanase